MISLGRLVVGCVLLVVTPPVALAQSQTQALTDLSRSFEMLAERTTPAVVQIFTVGYGAVSQAGGQVLALGERTGSGVLVSADGYIVTNAHVVSGARRIEVLLSERAVAAASTNSILKPVGKRLVADLIGTIQRKSIHFGVSKRFCYTKSKTDLWCFSKEWCFSYCYLQR